MAKKAATKDDFEKEKSSKEKPSVKGFIGFLRSEKFRRIVGFLFIAFALSLPIAFTSFLISWEFDQSVVSGLSLGRLFEINPDVAQNWLGIGGAWISHVLIYNGFGIASYSFALLSFLIGVKLFSGTSLLPIGKSFAYAFFGVIWLSILLGSIFKTHYFNAGGSFGYFGYLWLKSIAGNIGVIIFLTGYLAIFSIVVFNTDFSFLLTPFKKLSTSSKDKTSVLTDDNLQTTFQPVAQDYNTGNVVTFSPDSFETEANSFKENLDDIPPFDADDIRDDEVAQSISLSKKTVKVLKQELTFEVEDTTQREDEVAEIVEERTRTTAEELVAEFGLYDPTLDLSNYVKPTLDLLSDYPNIKSQVDVKELEEKKNMILDTLKNYNIEIQSIKATIGPTVTLYEIVPAAGVRIAKIKNLEKTALMSPKFQSSEMDLPIVLGKTITNEVYVTDLAKMPHLLMAGATGQGKSVGLNALIVSLLYKKHPAELKFVMVDPKKVELSLYKHIENHFLAKLPGDADAILTDTSLVVNTLKSLCLEMDQRYELLKHAEVRNLKEYNKKFLERRLSPVDGHRFLPYIVLIIDELADLMMTAGKEVELPIARLAQLARAIGIHLVLATQRPSVNIITGTIKANFPARLAFRVISKIDSRTILDSGGADQLIGKGDMLFSTGNDLIRLQCPFVDTPEVERIASFIGQQQGYAHPMHLPENFEGAEKEKETFDPKERDALFEDAARIIVQMQQGSTSLLQRRMNLGYNRAGRLIDQMEACGIVGPNVGSKARDVLIKDIDTLDRILENMI
ncbi:MAG: DNA translocase FtsK 4TM domain-containing protein [Bacteroidetes bacterium]|nr:DNA translocase FtsK 4TM domain-containing protein [Bacteroidota bacterium]